MTLLALKKLSVATKRKISLAHIGKKFTPEHRANMRLAQQGENNGMYGKRHFKDTKRKISLSVKLNR